MTAGPPRLCLAAGGMMSTGQQAAVLFLGGIMIRSTDPVATTFGRSHPAQLPRLSATAGRGGISTWR